MTHDAMRLTPMGIVFRGHRYPVRIGRGGVSKTKREGDGATPVGKMRIVGMLWRADRLPRPNMWAKPIGPNDLWCDAPESVHYNQPVRGPFSASHEKLRRPDPLYDIVFITDWNYPHATAHRGSAIFLHQRRGPALPTAGCIAFARHDLIRIARLVELGTEIIVPDLASFHRAP